jgi:hypothetical protein
MPNSDSHARRNRAYIAGSLLAAVAAGTIGVVLLTGGNEQSAAGSPTTPAPRVSAPANTAPTPEPSPSTPATVPTPEDVAVSAAKDKYLEYVRAGDQVAQGGYQDLKPYDAVAIDPERTELTLEARDSAGIRTSGNSEVAALEAESVKLSTDPDASYSEVQLRGCLDVSKVEALAADGSSATADTRLPRIAFTALLQQIPASAFTDSGRPGGWYVAKVEYPGGGTPC